MLQTSTSTLAPAIGAMHAASETIQSRFGEIVVDRSKSVEFLHGLLGMSDMLHFALTHFPSEKMKQFMLLQSLDDKSVSFITLPLPLDNAIIAAADLRAVCNELNIAEADMATLLIVSVHRSLTEVKLSVNARAPLIIDSVRRTGTQHVFQNDKYKVQHML
jgi:flagellar assembly factor FliW